MKTGETTDLKEDILNYIHIKKWKILLSNGQ